MKIVQVDEVQGYKVNKISNSNKEGIKELIQVFILYWFNLKMIFKFKLENQWIIIEEYWL